MKLASSAAQSLIVVFSAFSFILTSGLIDQTETIYVPLTPEAETILDNDFRYGEAR